MKRQLSSREIILLGLLLVMASVSGYIYLFYMPMTSERDRLRDETVVCEEQIAMEQGRIEEKRRMEKELKEIFAANPNPLSLAPYDNIKPVMVELNSILQSAQQYSLSFGTPNTEEEIARRMVSLQFSADSYETAKQVLNKLHDSEFRCMLNDVGVTLGDGNGAVSVNATLLYFEYQEKQEKQEQQQEQQQQ